MGVKSLHGIVYGFAGFTVGFQLPEKILKLLASRGWQSSTFCFLTFAAICVLFGTTSGFELVEALGETLAELLDLAVEHINFLIKLCLGFVVSGLIRRGKRIRWQS